MNLHLKVLAQIQNNKRNESRFSYEGVFINGKVNYNDNGELTMGGTSLKLLHKVLVHLRLFTMKTKFVIR